MRIGVLRTQVPFVNGGAERHAARLCKALREYGYDAVEVTVPFKWYPAGTLVDSILAARLLDVSEYDGVPLDLAIGLKFPAYLMRHPKKVFWIIHQHRQAYDQWDSGVSDLLQYPDGQAIRRFIHSEDQMALAGTHRPIFANSKNVASRIERYLDRKAVPLYHPPPLEEEMRLGKYGDYILAPGRINPSKRLDLVVQALARSGPKLRVVIAGTYENRKYFEDLNALADRLGVSRQIEWRGSVDDATMVQLYADARAVVFVPLDEDYGYVSLEAMLSGKPVITVSDAGGPLEFVEHNTTGYICEPNPSALAHAFQEVMDDKDHAERLGSEGLDRYRKMGISWHHVVEQLIGEETAKQSLSRGRGAAKKVDFATAPPQVTAGELLRETVKPPHTTNCRFKSIGDVFEAYSFTNGSLEQVADKRTSEANLIEYFTTHWTRYLTTLAFIEEIRPQRVLDVGVFPPLVFEAMIVNALPGVRIDGVWEGPLPMLCRAVGRNPHFLDFDLQVKVANIEKDSLPFPDNEFDLVLGMEIIEHLALDPYFFFCEIARVLKPGGSALLTTPNIGSHRGVSKSLNGMAPYSFGIFVPTGGVYGRHNREYTPNEISSLGQAAGLATKHLRTFDVYDDSVDSAVAELLFERGDDFTLRGETIFYVGSKASEPTGSLPELYFGKPEKLSGEVELGMHEESTGLCDVFLKNTSRSWWANSGLYATFLAIEWSNMDGYLVHQCSLIQLNDAVPPEGVAKVVLHLDAAGVEPDGFISLKLWQHGIGSFMGAGRSNAIMVPCSEEMFLKMARQASVESAS